MKKRLFKKVVIVGVGLMGGSLGMALKQNKVADQVVGLVRRRNSIKGILASGAVDKCVQSFEEAGSNADLVVLAGPVSTTSVLFEKLQPFLQAGCLITDVGSTKTQLVKKMEQLVYRKYKQSGLRFVGSHPMAGSEKTGVRAAFSTLYAQSVCLLIETENTTSNELNKLEKMWRVVGCHRVIRMGAKEHDRLTALVSHLPHAVVTVLASQVAEGNEKNTAYIQILGTGFKDTTRIAGGSAEMWQDIFLSNQKQMIKAINAFQKKMGQLKNLIEKQNERALLKFLEEARSFRNGLEMKSGRKKD